MSQGLPKTRAEVKDLQRLRQLFLDAPGRDGVADYWSDESLIALYDSTYARRIAWKWNAVLEELTGRNWQFPAPLRRWVDWGCGSGVATETVLGFAQDCPPTEILLSDRSLRARAYATKKLEKATSGSIRISHESPEKTQFTENDAVFISHVLTELNADQLNRLITQLKNAGTILWVEPGTPHCSQKLALVRDALLETYDIIAPCPHTSRCPLGNSSADWCHFFAQPPTEVFHDSFWSSFSKELNIDLRSLPVSFLVLQNKQFGLQQQKNTHDRILARPRFYKGHAKALVCTHDGLAETRQLAQRKFKSEFKDWEKNCFFAELTNDQDSD